MAADAAGRVPSFGIRFVLMHPRSGGNVGAAARALKNFGHGDWSIVRGEPYDEEEARRMAVQSGDVLEAARISASLDDAVADCAWVVGTSSRRRRGVRRLSPREWAREAASRVGAGHVALVFGEERSGLSNEELDRCHDVSAIPTDESQPSVNLAQALLIYAYEARLALNRPAGPPTLPIAASDVEVRALTATLQGLLDDCGFLRHDPRPALQGLTDTLTRSRLTRDEARLWTAALQSIRKGPRR